MLENGAANVLHDSTYGTNLEKMDSGINKIWESLLWSNSGHFYYLL